MLRNAVEDQTVLSMPLHGAVAPPEISAGDKKSTTFATRFTRNAGASVARLIVTTLVALVLPAYLTHRLSGTLYSTWVLILQMSAYVSYLDFGVQNGISKFVAEYDAKGDPIGANQRASAGFAIMLCTSLVGVVVTLVLAWQVPRFFSQMPHALYGDVRTSLILVGVSLAFGLVCSVFSSIFLGLQRYGVPMILSILNRVLFTAVVCFAVYRHSTLAVMGAAVAGTNIFTGTLQL